MSRADGDRLDGKSQAGRVSSSQLDPIGDRQGQEAGWGGGCGGRGLEAGLVVFGPDGSVLLCLLPSTQLGASCSAAAGLARTDLTSTRKDMGTGHGLEMGSTAGSPLQELVALPADAPTEATHGGRSCAAGPDRPAQVPSRLVQVPPEVRSFGGYACMVALV